MTISSVNAKRVFVLEIGGLVYRYHSTSPPSSTNLDSEITTGIDYIDREGILSVGSFSASLDPSGGVGEYSPVSITLAIDKKGDLGDAGVVFGRCGARSSGDKSQISSSMTRSSPLVGADASFISSLTYPKLLHIGAETVRANSDLQPTLDLISVTRGVGNTPIQNHSIALEGSIVPEITEHITTFRGRRAKLLGAHQYRDGSVSDYVEIINGFIESSPVIEDGQTISLSVVPLSAMIDTSLSDKISQTRLLTGYHYFDGQFGSALEYATELNQREEFFSVFGVNTGASISASTYQVVSVEEAHFFNADISGDINDFDPTLPNGSDIDTYTQEHPRYPRLQISIDPVSIKASYPTNITFVSSSTNSEINQIHADITPDNSLTTAEITDSGFLLIPLERAEIKAHFISEGVHKFPNIINDTLESEGATVVTGFDGAVAKWRLDVGNRRIIASKISDSIYPVSVHLWSNAYAWTNYAREKYARYPRRFDANGDYRELNSPARLSYPIDIGSEEDPFSDDMRDAPTSLIKQCRVEPQSTNTMQLRDIASAYYQLYEQRILVESSLGLPSSATVDEYYWITVRYYDRASESTKDQFFQVTHETVATYDSSNIGYFLHIRPGQDFSRNFSFGDWSSGERALIFRGGRFVGENAGIVLLQLLESGGGDEINGDYDVLSVGLNIHSDNIDEQSFLAVGSATSFLFSDQYAGDGTDLRSTFESILRLLGSALVMKRDEETGRSKIALIPIGAEKSKESVLTIQAGDFFADPVPTWDIYEDIVTQIEFNFDYDPAEEDYRSTVLFNDQEAINRYGGERSKITLDLPGVSSDQFGRGAGDTYSQFIPTANRIFSLLANPLRIWRGSISTGSSIYLDLGSYVKASSPHLRGYGDEYGVTNEIAMVRSINQNLSEEGSDLELLKTGLSPVAWNSSASVSAIVDTDTITISSSEYSDADINFFNVGDVVDFLPTGDQDNSITGLEIDSISGNDITFTSAHGISSADGTIEPTTYSNASSNHKEDAYLANINNLLDSTDDAQEYS